MTNTQKKYTVADIKNRSTNHFFSRDTMKFFGDKMASFATVLLDGETVLYRKPSAMVRTFTGMKRAGKDFFGAWRFEPETGNLRILNGEEKDRVYAIIAGRY